MSDDLFRVYLDPAEIDDATGYPWQWKYGVKTASDLFKPGDDWSAYVAAKRRIPDVVREQAGHRCVRCLHPFVVGSTPGRWSPCSEECLHGGPIRYREIMRGDGSWTEGIRGIDASGESMFDFDQSQRRVQRYEHEAEWRVLTVHHLNGIKHDCRWWNLVALCQRCHLTIQGKVRMERPWVKEHSDWFKPYVAGFYAATFLDEELTRPEVEARLDDLLGLQDHTPRMF